MENTKKLINAIKLKSESSVLRLLQSGANPNACFKDVDYYNTNSTPLIYTIRNGASVKLLRLLLQHGAKPDFEAFKLVINKCDINTVKLFIDYGADPSYSPVRNPNVLHVVIESTHPDKYIIAELLLKRGAQVDHENECYTTPLFYSFSSNKEMIEILLKYGARPCYIHGRITPLRRSFDLPQAIAENMIRYAALQVQHSNDTEMNSFFQVFTAVDTSGYNVKIGRQYINYAQQCMAEINILKLLELGRNSLTLFDFTVSYGSSCTYYSDIIVLQNIFKCLQTANLPIYSEVIMKKIDREEILAKLLEASTQKKFFSTNYSKKICLDSYSVENIVKHLSIMDIWNLFIAISFI